MGKRKAEETESGGSEGDVSSDYEEQPRKKQKSENEVRKEDKKSKKEKKEKKEKKSKKSKEEKSEDDVVTFGAGKIRRAQFKRNAMCEHGMLNYLCKPCGGRGVCPHGRERYYCVDCGGNGMCLQHGKRKQNCSECKKEIPEELRQKMEAAKKITLRLKIEPPPPPKAPEPKKGAKISKRNLVKLRPESQYYCRHGVQVTPCVVCKIHTEETGGSKEAESVRESGKETRCETEWAEPKTSQSEGERHRGQGVESVRQGNEEKRKEKSLGVRGPHREEETTTDVRNETTSDGSQKVQPTENKRQIQMEKGNGNVREGKEKEGRVKQGKDKEKAETNHGAYKRARSEKVTYMDKGGDMYSENGIHIKESQKGIDPDNDGSKIEKGETGARKRVRTRHGPVQTNTASEAPLEPTKNTVRMTEKTDNRTSNATGESEVTFSPLKKTPQFRRTREQNPAKVGAKNAAGWGEGDTQSPLRKKPQFQMAKVRSTGTNGEEKKEQATRRLTRSRGMK
eukprot:comp21568_c0_seq1/m.30121 comp21568_c0_seq1/g.30121  ORF comp21568_c0_seq1/g.30121 comp21568_c0_seq1/m.30121 type:complete len:509 (-) comp21568_c0_seq1:97-1623(-)